MKAAILTLWQAMADCIERGIATEGTRKGDEHGLQPNWPISYEDLAPFYEKADRLIGTSGLEGDLAMPPRDPCPTGPLPFTRAAGRLAEAFDKLGWHWWPAEAGVISENYDGRRAATAAGFATAARVAR